MGQHMQGTCESEKKHKGQQYVQQQQQSLCACGFFPETTKVSDSNAPSIIQIQTQTTTIAIMSAFDSPQTTTETSQSTSNNSASPPSGNGGGDVLLQWGHRKRSRASRVGAIEDSSSSVHVHPKQKKRTISSNHTVAAKFSSGSMPPPPPFVSSSSAAASNGRIRKCSPRNLEDPSAAGSESPSRNSQCSNSVISKSSVPKKPASGMERSNKRVPSSVSAKSQKPSFSSTKQAYERLNNSTTSHGDSASVQSEQEHGGIHAAPPAAASLAANGDNKITLEWPRIYIALSRKEKEDDFLAMKGTKIPQRPKKRAKNIDRSLQYCFPGMWLSDLTKSRYEVREKKSVKKQKRRGLKGMESLDSESE